MPKENEKQMEHKAIVTISACSTILSCFLQKKRKIIKKERKKCLGQPPANSEREDGGWLGTSMLNKP